MDHDKTLPVVVETTARTQHVSRHSRARVLLSALFVLAAVQCARVASTVGIGFSHATVNVPLHAEEALSKCRLLEVPPGPSPSFHTRSQSDRFVPGTKATLITVGRHSAAGCEGPLLTRLLQNATVWTGGADGLEVVNGDILLDGGIIQRIHSVDGSSRDRYEDYSTESVTRIDAQGKWVSPG